MKDALAEYAVKEAFLKKSSSLLRQKQRGKITSAEDKAKILQFIDENHQAIPVGNVVLSCGQFEVNRSCILSIKYMAEILGIGQHTYTNWKKSLQDKRKVAFHPNNAKYSEEVRQQALEALLLNPDMSPSELWLNTLMRMEFT